VQSKYVADVGDFGKYGLLRALCAPDVAQPQDLRLGVVWYLVSDDQLMDGRHRAYLGRPTEFRVCDPELFDALSRISASGGRHVSHVSKSNLLGVGTKYFEPLISVEATLGSGIAAQGQRRIHRGSWLNRALGQVADCDVIFLDPDNGIGGRSFRPYRRMGHKQCGWDEIEAFASSDRTVVVYHHTGRNGSATAQAKALAMGMKARFPSVRPIVLGFRRGTHRLFVVAAAAPQAEKIEERLERFMTSPWNQHFDRLV
jgi:hypothetical protein